MRIELKKFGITLISRQAGSEALKAFQPILRNIKPDEELEIDFSGVLTFSPSWGDEFLTPLMEQFGDRLVMLPSSNLSVQATLNLLQKIFEKPKKIKLFLQKYFSQVYPLSSVELDGDEKVGGVYFFKVFNKAGKQKIIGLSEEFCHWVIEKGNMRSEQESLGDYANDFREPNDVQIFFSSGRPLVYKWYKALTYSEPIRQ